MKIFLCALFFIWLAPLSKAATTELDKQLGWLVGKWNCESASTTSFKGKKNSMKGRGTFVVTADSQSGWLAGIFETEGEHRLVTRSYYSWNQETKSLQMVFFDSQTGFGTGISKGDEIRFQGANKFGNYNSEMTKTFKQVSPTEYVTLVDVLNKADSFRLHSEVHCSKIQRF